MTLVREALAADRRLTIRELVEQFEMSYGTMHRVLTEDLHEPCCKKVSDHSYNIVNANYQFSEEATGDSAEELSITPG